MRPNLNHGFCVTCGDEVQPQAGAAFPGEGKTWHIKCRECSGLIESKSPISITLEGDKFIIKPKKFLGGDLFSSFRNLIAGSRFDSARKLNVANRTAAIAIVARFQGSQDFVLDMQQDVIDALKEHISETHESVSLASERAEKTDELLRSRGLSLFPFQKTGVQWLASRTGALLADDMGLGKTIQTLIAVPNDSPVVVVAPAVAKGVWQRECNKWRPEIKVTILSGKGSFRWPDRNEMVVINYDILSSDTEELPIPGTVIIADEAHNLKNSKAKRTVAFRDLAKKATKYNGKVWLLTATPLLNRPGELWSIYSAAGIAEEAFGSWYNFCSLFNAYKNKWGATVWGKPSSSISEKIRRVSLRRTKTEVLPDLPQKMWKELNVELDRATVRMCQELEAKVGFDTLVSEVTDALELINKLGSACFEELSRVRAAIAKAKIPALLELVEDFEEQEEPVVVFSAHRAPIDFLQEKCGWTVITGDTPPEERTRIENEFQAGTIKKLAGTIKAMGVAITLTKASQAIFVDLEWTPALNSQAEDRLCRIGQTRGVCITTLVGNVNIDSRVIELLSKKRELIGLSVEAAANKAPNVIPTIDFDALKQAHDDESTKVDIALGRAAEREKKFAAESEKIAEANAAQQKELARKQLREKTIKYARNKDERRVAKTQEELWIVAALTTLSSYDPDRAREKNNIGFCAADSHVGHRLAILTEIGLTPEEWTKAGAMCKKYRRQVGSIN